MGLSNYLIYSWGARQTQNSNSTYVSPRMIKSTKKLGIRISVQIEANRFFYLGFPVIITTTVQMINNQSTVVFHQENPLQRKAEKRQEHRKVQSNVCRVMVCGSRSRRRVWSGYSKICPRLPSLHSFSPFHQMTIAKSVFVKAQSLGNSRWKFLRAGVFLFSKWWQ